jgi:hypothetical protein
VADCLMTGTNGADAVRFSYTKAGSSQETVFTVTMTNGWGHADNLAFGCFTQGTGATFTFEAGDGFTMLGQTVGSSSTAGLGTEYGRDGDNDVDMALTLSNTAIWSAVVLEIVGAANIPAAVATLRRTRRRGLNTRIN